MSLNTQSVNCSKACVSFIIIHSNLLSDVDVWLFMSICTQLFIKTEIITLYRFARNAENGMMTQVFINNLRNPALTSKRNPHWVGPDAAELVLRHAVVIPSVLDLAGRWKVNRPLVKL